MLCGVGRENQLRCFDSYHELIVEPFHSLADIDGFWKVYTVRDSSVSSLYPIQESKGYQLLCICADYDYSARNPLKLKGINDIGGSDDCFALAPP